MVQRTGGAVKYTQQGEEIDQVIQNYLDVIVASLRKDLSTIKGIVLGGGFGRGEGSVENKKGVLTPVNDFELFLFVDQKIPEEVINMTANKAVESFSFPQKGVPFYHFSREHYADTFYLDIKAFTSRDLKSLLPMIRYYELKNASTLIWGEDFRPLMPDFSVKELPLAEGFRILLNRLAMLGLYFSSKFLEGKMSTSEKHGFLYIGGKTLVDIPTALLLLNGKFVPSYEARARIFLECYQADFPTLYEQCPELAELVSQATQDKFHPDFGKEIDPLRIFLNYRDSCFQALSYYLKKMFQKEYEGVDWASRKVFSAGKEYYGPYLRFRYGLVKSLVNLFIPVLNLLYFLRLVAQGSFYPRILINTSGPDLTLFSALLHLLFAVEESGTIDRRQLFLARKILRKTYPVPVFKEDLKEEWEGLSQVFANAYVLFFYLKIV